MSSIMREDWIEVELGEVFETVTGNTPSKKEIDNYGQDIPFIKPPDITNSTIKSVSEYLSNKGKKKARVLPQNSILVTCIGNLGRIGYNKDEIAFNQQINAILPLEQIDYKFTFYQAQSGNFRNQLESLSTSTTVALVNKSSFNSIKIGVAPLPIQRAIVSKIEALFSDLDNGIANIKKAQEQLKIYRQAVLKKAFEGGFSITNEELRITDSITNGELRITNEENHSSDNLPKGWKWVKLGDLGTWKGGGTPSKQVKKYWENGTNLWVSSKDMKVDIINDSIDKITDEAIINSSANRIPKGAILFVMRSGILRHTFPVAIAGRELTVNQDLQTLSPNGLASSEFIYWFIKAFNYDIRHNCSKDGTTVESIDSSSLKDYPFLLPPIQEQNQIVQEIESRLSVTDNLEFIIRNSIEKAEALRQSILKKAFEGKLLSEAEIAQCKQAADYEPASELLKKIQAEKLAKEQEKKKKPKTKK